MNKPVILCVDDEPGILKSLERCLSFEQYEVVQAAGGQQGLEALQARDGRVDLIIVDQKMPRMTGDEFLKQVQMRFGSVKSIMLSGHIDSETLAKAGGEKQIVRIIQKPWDNQELLKVIQAEISSAT